MPWNLVYAFVETTQIDGIILSNRIHILYILVGPTYEDFIEIRVRQEWRLSEPAPRSFAQPGGCMSQIW